MYNPASAFLVAGVTTVGAIYGLRAFARRVNLLDIPNERSAHTEPVPRIGGLGIACGVWAAVLVSSSGRQPQALWLALLSTLPLYLLAYDDALAAVGKGMAQGSKLATQLGASTLFVFKAGYVLNHVTLPAIGYVPLGGIAVPLTLLWLVYITNIYNFMDGIDGLAGSQGLLIAAFLFCIGMHAGTSALYTLAVALAGASAGFLCFNRPPASIIMGDVGSAFLGFLIAASAVIGEPEGVTFLSVPILLGPFLFDATYTIIRRISRGENIFQAHRLHLYQRLQRMGVSPGRVDLIYAVALLPCGVSAVLLNRGRGFQSLVAFDAFLTLAILGTWAVERRWNHYLPACPQEQPTSYHGGDRQGDGLKRQQRPVPPPAPGSP